MYRNHVYSLLPLLLVYIVSQLIDRLAATFQLADMAGDIQGSSDQTAKPFLKLFIHTYSKVYFGI